MKRGEGFIHHSSFRVHHSSPPPPLAKHIPLPAHTHQALRAVRVRGVRENPVAGEGRITE